MIRSLPVLSVLLSAAVAAAVAGGCNPKNSTPEPVPEPTPAPVPEPVHVPTVKELYTECMERVENPQADAECKTDADCGTAGCGKEVCTTTAEVANINTTCEDKLCFKILDVCGCHEGHCTWTTKAEVPEGQIPTTNGSALPPSLPGMTPKPDGMQPEPAPAPAPN